MLCLCEYDRYVSCIISILLPHISNNSRARLQTLGYATIGRDSCLGFSACEELSGSISIRDDSCYGLKSCSNSSKDSTINIYSNSCVGARSCASMSGFSVVSNSSCHGPKSCSFVNDGELISCALSLSFANFAPQPIPNPNSQVTYRITVVSGAPHAMDWQVRESFYSNTSSSVILKYLIPLQLVVFRRCRYLELPRLSKL